MQKEDLKQIRDIVRDELNFVSKRVEILDMKVNSASDRLDHIEDKMDTINEEVKYVKQFIIEMNTQMHEEVKQLRKVENEDILALHGDIFKLGKRLIKLEKASA